MRADRHRARRRRAICRRSADRGQLNWRIRCGCRPWARQMRWTELTLSPAAFAIEAPVQWVVSPGGSPSVKATTRSAASALSGLISRDASVTNQAVESVLHKAFLPAPNAGLGLGRSPHDLVRADAIGGQQHDSAADVLLRRGGLHHSFEPANIGGRNGEGFPARIAQMHVEPASGIPAKTEMLGRTSLRAISLVIQQRKSRDAPITRRSVIPT